MSGIGHIAAGLVAKPAAPQVPLVILLAAGELNEILYFAFTTAGIEKKADFSMNFSQGVKYLTVGSNPWSHGLIMSLTWSIAAGLIGYLIYRHHRPAVVIGLVVFSHWVLDFLMHSNLPLFLDGSPLLGLGLENSGPGLIFMTILDLVLVVGGIVYYLNFRKNFKNE